MLASDNTSPTRFGVRVLLLLILIVPAVCGAVAAHLLPDTTTDARPFVAIVGTSTATPVSPGGKLTEKLSSTPGYTWQVMTATEAAKQLSTASVFAVVTIPDSFGTASAVKSPATTAAAGRVTVVPSGDASDVGYARLEQAVSGAATHAGLEGLLVSVSSARTNLNVAALTAAGLKAAAVNADTTVTEVLNSVNQLVGQADPLVAQAQTLVAAIREYSALINELSGTLSGFATSMRGVTLTLGDLQDGTAAMNNGLQVVADTLQATVVVRAQLASVIRPVAQALSVSNVPDGQQFGNQLTALLAVVDSAAAPGTAANLDGAQTGTQLLSAQLDNLAPLLGRPVDAQTRLVDVLDLAVLRLNDMGAFLVQGDATINQVMGQLIGAKDLVPTMEGQIRGQLDQLKAATAQLVTSLNAGVNGLPDTSAATVNRLSPTAGESRPAATTLDPLVFKAVLIVLLGSVVIAVLQIAGAQRLRTRGWVPNKAGAVSWAAAAVAGIGLAAVAGAVLGGSHTTAAYLSAGIAVLATVALSTALMHVAGLFGLGLMVASILVVTAVDAVMGSDDGFIAGLVPGHYVTAGLARASTTGLTESLLLPLLVLTGSALCAIVVSLRTASVMRGSAIASR